MGHVPENRGKRSPKGTLSVQYGETGEEEVKGRKETDDCNDDPCDFVVDGKKEFDEAGKEKEDSRVQEEGDVLNDPANMEPFNAVKKKCANFDAICRRV